MKIGLIDIDGHNFPNIPLMKISAWHKMRGDEVEMCFPSFRYDKIYISKVFSFTNNFEYAQADEIQRGGTGYAISVEGGKEVYDKSKDPPLPPEIEHMYPDYGLYNIKNEAYGFLTRGCCNNCGFCIVSKKEGLCSNHVADLSEFWNGQKNIKLMDANILACKDRERLLHQLIDSKAWIDYTQGLDARFITDDIAKLINKTKIKIVHFAFDFMKNEKAILKGLQTFKKYTSKTDRELKVYILTNYDTTFEEDIYRVNKVVELGYAPDVRIYMKDTAPQFLRDLQRWANNPKIFRTCKFEDYVPRVDGKTMKRLYNDIL